MTAFIIVLLVLTGILLIPVYAEVRCDKDASVTIKVLAFTVYRYNGEKKTKKKPQKPDKRQNEKEKPEKEASFLKEYFSLFKDLLFEIFRGVRKYAVIKNISVSYTFGFADAAFTGIFAGVAHAVINSFMAAVDHSFRVKEIDVNINPDFNKVSQTIDITLNIRVLLLHLVIILFNLVKISLKGYKNKKAVD